MNTQNWIKPDSRRGWVSVIIPTYNRAAMLKETLQSVVQQSYRPIECIVVDDGSTDQTENVLESYENQQDETFTFVTVKQENAGAQVARNVGTVLSSGEYIQYLDSDDLLYPNKISKQVSYLQNNGSCDFVFGDWENGSVEHKKLIQGYKSDNLIEQIVTLERPIHTLAFLMRRTLLVRAGSWDTSLKRMQEIDFQLSALVAGGSFEYQPLHCGLWRHHLEARIHNQTTVNEMLPFFQKWEQILSDRQQFSPEMGERISIWYMWFISQSKKQKLNTLLPVLQEAVRLQPSISFFATKKMKLLRFIVGRKNALAIWLLRYRLT